MQSTFHNTSTSKTPTYLSTLLNKGFPRWFDSTNNALAGITCVTSQRGWSTASDRRSLIYIVWLSKSINDVKTPCYLKKDTIVKWKKGSVSGGHKLSGLTVTWMMIGLSSLLEWQFWRRWRTIFPICMISLRMIMKG